MASGEKALREVRMNNSMRFSNISPVTDRRASNKSVQIGATTANEGIAKKLTQLETELVKEKAIV